MINNSTIDSFVKYSSRLSGVCLNYYSKDLSIAQMDRFFATFAKQLKAIHRKSTAGDIHESIVKGVKLCPNITAITHELYLNVSFVLNHRSDAIVFNILQAIKLLYNNESAGSFERFVNDYKNHMKSIHLVITGNCNELYIRSCGTVLKVPSITQ